MKNLYIWKFYTKENAFRYFFQEIAVVFYKNISEEFLFHNVLGTDHIKEYSFRTRERFQQIKKKELKFIKEFAKLKDLQEDVLSFKMPVHFCTSNHKLFYAGYAGGKEQ